MQKLQDKKTGLEWHFENNVDVSALQAIGTAPETLSSVIIPRPSDFHDWKDGGWVLNLEKQNAANNVEVLALIALEEAKQARPLRELLLNPSDAFAKSRLDAINASINELRARLV